MRIEVGNRYKGVNDIIDVISVTPDEIWCIVIKSKGLSTGVKFWISEEGFRSLYKPYVDIESEMETL